MLPSTTGLERLISNLYWVKSLLLLCVFVCLRGLRNQNHTKGILLLKRYYLGMLPEIFQCEFVVSNKIFQTQYETLWNHIQFKDCLFSTYFIYHQIIPRESLSNKPYFYWKSLTQKNAAICEISSKTGTWFYSISSFWKSIENTHRHLNHLWYRKYTHREKK